MNPLQKIGAFAAALTATFGAAYGVGGLLGPLAPETEPAPHAASHAASGTASEDHAAEDPASPPPGDLVPAGLQVSQDGYTLDLETTAVPAGRKATLRFVVRDAGGRPVTRYETAHGKQLHLILASRELTTYRHLHPARAADGTWSTTADLPAAGGYRVFADFVPAGRAQGLTLGSDLTVTGPYRAARPPAPAATTTVDGYTVTLAGALRAGGESDLTFTVRRAGRPVTGLQPHLGAYGHLVALRSGDLAYLHVHPHEEAEGEATSGPGVSFSATAPSAGTYRLFLDFKVAGTVRTAAFTVRTGSGAPAAPPSAHPSGTGGGPSHGH
ncbi:hypothetical protein ACH4F6_29530 [Streptomyces sp. NPDC017936]|uniref:hypothetical protein n=1 Tax=Streptomyces sp. NPDC017936 TaxID=3365016 RepID=UPI0037B2085B